MVPLWCRYKKISRHLIRLDSGRFQTAIRSSPALFLLLYDIPIMQENLILLPKPENPLPVAVEC